MPHRQLIAILISLCYSLALFGQLKPYRDDVRFGKDNGVAKKITLRYHQDTMAYDSIVYQFGDDGLKQSAVWYNHNTMEPEGKRYYTYDNKGNLLEIEKIIGSKRILVLEQDFERDTLVRSVERWGTHGEIKFTTKRKYNKQMQMIQKEMITKRSYSRHIYSYNENGLLTVQTEFDGSSDTTYWLIKRYDSKDRVANQRMFKPGAGMTSKKIYEYDNDGNLMEAVSFDGTGKQISKTEYEYNAEGLRTGLKKYLRGELVKKAEYHYDDHGNLVYNGFDSEYYKYNSRNLMTEKGKVGKDGEKRVEVRYLYEYVED